MKKDSSKSEGELRAAYKRSDFGKLVRGKYAARFASETNVVLLDLEVSKAFPNDRAVNDALRSLIAIAIRTTHPPRH